MAGDWIKMREDLHEDPAVLWMAQKLGVRPETVVGFCHRFWGLVSRQTGDGCLSGPTLSSLGNVIGLPGFPELLVRVGWLEHDENDGEMPVTRIPKFERHLSEGAKARALAAEKKRQQRVRNLSPKNRDKCPKKTGTREEKRRVSNISPISPSKKFVRPSVIDVQTYCSEASLLVNAQEFVDYYEAQGWKLSNGNAMKDWQATARRWSRNQKGSDGREVVKGGIRD